MEKEKNIQDTLNGADNNEACVNTGKRGRHARKNRDDDEDDIALELERISMEVGIAPKKDVIATDDIESKNKKENTEKKEMDEKKLNKERKGDNKKEMDGKTKKDNKQANVKGNRELNKVGQQGNGISKKDTKKIELSKKDKAKQKEDEQNASKAKKGPSKRILEAMKENLARQQEEKDRIKKEQLELERLEELRIHQIEENKKLEEDRKEKARQKQKEKLKKLKDEGKFLTAKQKLEQQRAKATLEMLRANGLPLPGTGSSESYPKRTRRRKQEVTSKETSPKLDEEPVAPKIIAEVKTDKVDVEMEEDGVKDAWDELTESEDETANYNEKNEVNSHGASSPVEDKSLQKEVNMLQTNLCLEQDREAEHQSKREKVKKKIEQRRLRNEKNRNLDNLHSPVVCVLGHVDHGKTKILDKLKGTNVQEGEAGNITQEIRATIVSKEIISSQTRMVKDFDLQSIKFPGLLIIDTPGHESFSNLRNRGSSLCDFAILVIDINQGVQPTTIESINLLKDRKTPFIVALNKVDLLYEWQSFPDLDIRKSIEAQYPHTKNDFERRSKQVINELEIQGLNAALFWENKNQKTYFSLIPTNAIGGDGMGNLISILCSLCQKRLAPKLQFSEELQCTVLEVSAIQGHGTTIYVILVNGRLKEGDTIVVAGSEGPILTQIRSLHIPKAKSRFQYEEFKEVIGTQGVMVAAKELDRAIAGWSLSVVTDDSEAEYLKDQVDKEFKLAMSSMKVKDKGVYVQASSIGALEALLALFKTNKVPCSGIKVGPVVKRDVMKASAMLEHDPMYAIILAFNVKVDKDAQELADKEGVKIFSEPIIYHLVDRFEEYIKTYKKKKQDEFKLSAIFPCKLQIMPDSIFNKRDPIVLGVSVIAGQLRTGTPLCVPSKEYVEIGIVASLEFDHKPVEIAKKGVDVCIKIEPMPGQTPKLFGRHFEGDDLLVSRITREGIDICKEYFRDDLTTLDWRLIKELKKDFSII